MGVSTGLSLFLLLALLVLREANAFLLDPDTVATLPPPKDFFAGPFFNGWARLVVAGIGFSFLHVAGVILAVKRKYNKIDNLEDYYQQLEEFFSEDFSGELPDAFPDYLQYKPGHDFPFPAELPGPGGWFGQKYVRPGLTGDNYDYFDDFFRRAGGSSDAAAPPPGPPTGSPQRHSATPHKRSLQAPPPKPKDLQETVKKLHEAKEMPEVVVKTAQLVQEVMERLDEDSCLLKLMCYLQGKPQDTRTPEQELLVRLYRFNAPVGAPGCGQEVSRCPVEETQMVEAFSYTWHRQNFV